MVLDSGVTVGAVVVVNSSGDVVDPATGLPWMDFLIEEFELTAAAGRADRTRSPAVADAALSAAEHHRSRSSRPTPR